MFLGKFQPNYLIQKGNYVIQKVKYLRYFIIKPLLFIYVNHGHRQRFLRPIRRRLRKMAVSDLHKHYTSWGICEAAGTIM